MGPTSVYFEKLITLRILRKKVKIKKKKKKEEDNRKKTRRELVP